MAQRGRKPKPTAIKVLEGNPGKRELNLSEPKPEKKAPKCPAWLEPEAKREWRRTADEVYMSPVAMMMIHNPATVIFGEVSDFQSGIAMLSEVKESIINAYEEKTRLSRAKISHMMDAESWFNAWKAVELGFADKVLYTTEDSNTESPGAAFIFDKMTVTNALVKRLPLGSAYQMAYCRRLLMKIPSPSQWL